MMTDEMKDVMCSECGTGYFEHLRRTKGGDGLEIVMTKQMQKMIDKELKKRFEELKPELATRYEELLNMRNMEADQFNDGFNDARAGKLETDQPHYDLDTDNWRLGYAWGMFELMKKEKLAREAALEERIAELEAEVTKCHELQDSYCDRIAKLEAYVAELEAKAEVQE